MTSTNNKITSNPFVLPPSSQPIAAEFSKEELEKIEKTAKAYILNGGSLEAWTRRHYVSAVQKLTDQLNAFQAGADNSDKVALHALNLHSRLKKVWEIVKTAKREYYQNTLLGRITVFLGLATAIDHAAEATQKADADFFKTFEEGCKQKLEFNSPNNFQALEQALKNAEKAIDEDPERLKDIADAQARDLATRTGHKKKRSVKAPKTQAFDPRVAVRNIDPVKGATIKPQRTGKCDPKDPGRLCTKRWPKGVNTLEDRQQRIERCNQAFNEIYGPTAPQEWVNDTQEDIYTFRDI